MRTGVSGMNAQATRLSTVAENIANVNTTGYKNASCEFSTLLLSSCPGDYESGSVLNNIRYHVSNQGSLTGTGTATDLAISGDGFFVVADRDGSPFLTRAGAFVPDGEGNLMNAAGLTLQGYRLDPDQPDVTVNGYSNLVDVNLEGLALSAAPSTTGEFVANLPSTAMAVAAGALPSDNVATSEFTAKSSLLTYDNLGAEVRLDIFFTKTANNAWEVAVFDAAAADPDDGFPYASGPLTTETLTFDSESGSLAATSAAALDIDIPDGRTFTLDVSDVTQLATDYAVLSARADGNAPSGADVIEIASDGLVYATYGNGTRVPVFRIPLAHVTSPDQLIPQAGNLYTTSALSGDVEIGFAEVGPLGKIVSGALEQSTVDLATELTTMIDAQRSYTANSKVFQTGSELMDVLVNLKR
jgi:flagellar hook protein FlgE